MSEKRIWILFRGLVREQRHWETFPEVFRGFFPEDDIFLFDFSGNGRRYRERSAATIPAMVEQARSFVADQNIDKPVHIMALSLGAMVAVEWMRLYPDECAASVLLSTSLRGLNPFYQRLLPSNYYAILRSLLVPGSIRQKEVANLKLVSNIVLNDKEKREQVIEHWVAYAEQCPVSGMNALRQLLAAMRFYVPGERPDVSMLVLNSAADKLVSPLCSVSLANHWHLPIETHDTAGHDIALDDAEWVCKKVRQWLTDPV